MRRLRDQLEWIVRLWLVAAATAALGSHYPIIPVPNSPHGIYQMFQDSRSALWLGTIDDVVCFDGENFYSLRQYGFPRETPNSFAEDGQGALWIGTQGTDSGGGTGRGGLYRYQAGRVEKIFAGDVLSVVAVGPGIMLSSVGTEASGKPAFGDLLLFQKAANQWAPTKLLDKQADHLTVDHQGNVLFPCPGGWCEIAHERLLQKRASEADLGIKRNAGSPLLERVLRDRFGCVWFRAEAFSSYQCPADAEPKIVPVKVSLYDNSAHLEETADGSIFMLVRLALGRPGAFHVANKDDGLPSIDTAIVGRDGTIWIGSDTGLYRFMYPFRLKLWDKNDGAEYAASFLRRGKDVLISSEGLRKLDEHGVSWTNLWKTGRKTADTVARPDGTIIETDDTRVNERDGSGKLIASLDLPGSELGYRLTSSREGDVWLGHKGISRVIAKKYGITLQAIRKSDVTDYLAYDDLHHILWACEGSSLIFLKDGRWSSITQKDGLLNFPCQTFGIQANGNAWLGYNNAAAFSFIQDPTSGHPKIQNYTKGLNNREADSFGKKFSIDQRGWVWRTADALYLGTSGAARSGEWLRLDGQDGIAPPEDQSDHSFDSDPDGSVWLATGDGVEHFSPSDDFATRFPAPAIFVSGFSSANNTATLADTVDTLPRDANVTAHIGSLQFDRRSALHLRYRVLPEQTAWTGSNSLQVQLGRPRWGHYRLQVQAQLATGPWSPVSEESFSVLWPFWLTWPMLLTYCAAGTGLSIGATQWNKRQRSIRETMLPDLANWRMKALSPESGDLLGTIIDNRYEIGHILSIGGFATVVRARDLQADGQLCAVKLFRFEIGNEAWIRHRFDQEVMALEQLSHPSIVKITGHGATAKGAPYLVMEFIHGQNLRDLRQSGALPPSTVARFLRQISEALGTLHKAMIFHRDIKPENLMVRADEDNRQQLVLIDFSIAIVKTPEQTFHGISRVAGTLEYMAPEQVIGYADASTDIYSLAKVLMEMITGLTWANLLPEATLDLPEQVRSYLVTHQPLMSNESIDMIAAALMFDPDRRPKQVILFAQPIIRDLERAN